MKKVVDTRSEEESEESEDDVCDVSAEVLKNYLQLQRNVHYGG